MVRLHPPSLLPCLSRPLRVCRRKVRPPLPLRSTWAPASWAPSSSPRSSARRQRRQLARPQRNQQRQQLQPRERARLETAMLAANLYQGCHSPPPKRPSLMCEQQNVVSAAQQLDSPVGTSQQHMIQPMQCAASARAAAPLQKPAHCTTIPAGSPPRPQLTHGRGSLQHE